MQYLLIFLVITLSGLLAYFTIKKSKTWKYMIATLIIIIGVLLLFGFRFTASSALPMGAKVIQSKNTSFGKAILYEDKNNHTFGLAKINRNLGFLYYYAGGASDYFIEGNEPFQAAGFGNEDGFMVGVRIGNPNIKYIVVGNTLGNLTPSDIYHFNMKTVEENPDSYHVERVVNNYAFFVLDNYTRATWTIRALDKDGNLIADKLFGTGEARYIEW